MTIATGLSATKTGFDLIKSLREIVKRPDVDAADVSARLLELQELMLDARNALSEAGDKEKKLEARIEQLLRMADFAKDLIPGHGLYWKDQFPYCPTCWDIDRQPVRLGGPLPGNRGDKNWRCPIHKVEFVTRYGFVPRGKDLTSSA